MIKLLYITNGINGAGGLERVLSIKASFLADSFGYEVHILTLNEKEVTPFYSFSPAIKYVNIEVSSNSVSYIFTYINGIRNVVNDIEPDIISICDDGLKAFFLPAIVLNKIPLVYERHVSKEIEMNVDYSLWRKAWINLKWYIMSIQAKQFSRFVVLTKGNVNEWNKLRNLEIIPNPISFYPQSISSLNNRKVIAVGRHGYQKGFDRLLKAWKIVIDEHPDWKLAIYGKSNSNYNINDLAVELDIQSTVEFHAPTQDIKQKYLESSIYVLPSRYEGFGMVLIEAMACGVPCVSFDCPHGPADIISNGEDGFIVENNNISALASSIIKLIENNKLRYRMGSKAKENVKRYLPENVVPEWDYLFNQLIKETRR